MMYGIVLIVKISTRPFLGFFIRDKPFQHNQGFFLSSSFKNIAEWGEENSLMARFLKQHYMLGSKVREYLQERSPNAEKAE